MSHSAEQWHSSPRVAVFGASGFLGAEVIRALLRAGAEPYAVASPSGTVWRLEEVSDHVALDRVDVRDSAMVERYFSRVRPHHVVNAVRPGGGLGATQRQLFETIVAGTHHLLTAGTAAGCERFVQVGSASEYGRCDEAIDESLAPMPQTAFGGAKAAATMLCLAAGRSGAMASVVVRPFMVYGPRDVPTRLVPTILRSALDGTELRLTPPGYRRDWVFAADVANACVAALSGGADGHVVNLGTGVDRDNEDLVRIVERATGRKLRVCAGAYVPRPWDRPRWLAATIKARALLGWEAQTTLEEGLRKTLAWARDAAPVPGSAQVTAPGLRK